MQTEKERLKTEAETKVEAMATIAEVLCSIAERTIKAFNDFESLAPVWGERKPNKGQYVLKQLNLSEYQRKVIMSLPPARVEDESVEFYKIRRPLQEYILKNFKATIPFSEHIKVKKAMAASKTSTK